MDPAAFNEELQRTAFQKKTATRIPPDAVLDLAIAFFSERGYRAARTGRPNQMFIMGGREGALPRVTGEIIARGDVGKPGTTLVTLDAAGERLGPAMQDFLDHLRARSKTLRGPDATRSLARPGIERVPETVADEIEGQNGDQQGETGSE